jgi:deazaflavin-dependent oxidoreductase (nitroreductase family)
MTHSLCRRLPLRRNQSFVVWLAFHTRFLENAMAFHRWMYRGGRPNLLAKAMNRGWAFLHALGIAPGRYVTLEVVGRKSGKLISFPLVMATVDGQRYLVSMLGEEANWVQNIKASGGKATLRHGVSEQVVLKEIEGNQKASILKAYLQLAPGARPHVPISKDAPLAEFEAIMAQYPVFRIDPAELRSTTTK